MSYFLHDVITISDLIISFATKDCINEPFSTRIYSGMRIGIIGNNGSGKSSLLKMLLDADKHKDVIHLADDVVMGYVPQLIEEYSTLSGGQKFNKKLSEVISLSPNLLLLDEPTNHLDSENRKSLFTLLKRYQGTLIVITHDVELLNYVDTLWHIKNGSVGVFNGNYYEYMQEQQIELNKLTTKIKQLDKEKKSIHDKLMLEQSRAKKKSDYGEKKHGNDKIGAGSAKGRSEATNSKNLKNINNSRQNIMSSLQDIYIHEVIVPRFYLDANAISSSKMVLSIVNGSCFYGNNEVLQDINLNVLATEKNLLTGVNGSGKSTLIKAILDNPQITKNGEWFYPKLHDIGYLDQHYSNLSPEFNAVEIIQQVVPQWSHGEIRNHLNTFLLRKNEEVAIASKYLSGGERVRLSLAVIAVKPPKLLILDEITNNIDLETKQHLINVLSEYAGAMLLVCHDKEFVNALPIDRSYQIKDSKVCEISN